MGSGAIEVALVPEEKMKKRRPVIDWKQRDKYGHILFPKGAIIARRYEIQRTIGAGSFGNVWKVRDLQSELRYAMKVSLDKTYRNEKGEDLPDKEADTLMKLNRLTPSNGPRVIVKLVDSFVLNHRVFNVMELLATNLYKFMYGNHFQPFRAQQGVQISKQLITAVHFLHSQGYIHTDLKPENIGIVCDAYTIEMNPGNAEFPEYRVLKRTEIRLLDLGSAVRAGKRNYVVATRPYRSPECVLKQEWDRSVDMWGLGCTLMDIWTGLSIFDVNTDRELLHRMQTILGPLPQRLLYLAPIPFLEDHDYNITYGCRPWEKKGDPMAATTNPIPTRLANYFEQSDKYQRQAHSLIRGMLKYEPSARVSVEEALKDPLFLH